MALNRHSCLSVYLTIGFIIVAKLLNAQTWTQEADFGGGGRQYSAYAATSTHGYIGFGNNTQVNDFWEFDPAANKWTQKAPIPSSAGRAEMIGFAIGNEVYVGMGFETGVGESNDFWKFDPSSNTWTKIAPYPGAWLRGAIAITIGTKGYVVAGVTTGGTPMLEVWEYDPSNNTWSQKADMPSSAQRYFGVGFGIGSKGYIGTGVVGSTAQDDFWEYDPLADTWTQKTNFGGGIRVNAVGFSSTTRGYIGTGGNNLGPQFNDLWEYNPANDSWTKQPDYPGAGRFAGAGFAIGCACYLGVGTDYNGSTFTMHQDFWKLSVSSGANITVTGDTTICAGKPVLLSASGGSTYTWSPDIALSSTTGNTVTVSPDSTITYTVTSTVGACSGSASVKINVANSVAASVSISASPSTPVCPGEQVTFTAVPVNAGNPTYQWKINNINVGNNTPVLNSSSLKDSDVVTCLIISGLSCSSGIPDISNVLVARILPSVVAGNIIAGGDTVCAGSSIALSDSGSIGAIQWQFSADGISFTDVGDTFPAYNINGINLTGYYRLSANGTCGTDSSSVFKLTVNSLPEPVVIASDSIICSSDSVAITIQGSYSSYTWSNGDSTSYIYTKAAGGYWVTVTDANGCSAGSDHINIKVYPAPSVSLVLNGDTIASFNSTSYQWYFNDTIIPGANSEVYIAAQSGEYSLEIIDSNGCKAQSNDVPINISALADLSGSTNWNIYPNPFNQQLIIEQVNNQFPMEGIELYDILGRNVIHQINNSHSQTYSVVINSDILPDGIYIVKINSDKRDYLYKVIKQ